MLLTAQPKQVKTKPLLAVVRIVAAKIVLAAHLAVAAAEVVAKNKGIVL
jgi:hypothetical protein